MSTRSSFRVYRSSQTKLRALGVTRGQATHIGCGVRVSSTLQQKLCELEHASRHWPHCTKQSGPAILRLGVHINAVLQKQLGYSVWNIRKNRQYQWRTAILEARVHDESLSAAIGKSSEKRDLTIHKSDCTPSSFCALHLAHLRPSSPPQHTSRFEQLRARCSA